MKIQVTKIILLMTLCVFSLSSCWVQRTITVTDKESQYLGNRYDKMKGYTENQILQVMSVPDRTMSDGKGGKILIYENKTLVTNSNAVASSVTTTNGAAVAGYTYGGNAAVVSGSKSAYDYGYSSQTTTHEDKAYVNFFINTEGICYNVNANIGDMWSQKVQHTECVKVANNNLLWLLMPPLTVWGIPVAIWYLTKRNVVKRCY